jgi:hypothetical protein
MGVLLEYSDSSRRHYILVSVALNSAGVTLSSGTSITVNN